MHSLFRMFGEGMISVQGLYPPASSDPAVSNGTDGGCRLVMVPQIIQVMDDHDLV